MSKKKKKKKKLSIANITQKQLDKHLEAIGKDRRENPDKWEKIDENDAFCLENPLDWEPEDEIKPDPEHLVWRFDPETNSMKQMKFKDVQKLYESSWRRSTYD